MSNISPKHPAGTFIPVIDRNRCEGKGPCVSACPYDVLEIGILPASERKTLSLKGRIKAWAHSDQQAFIKLPAACSACGECVKVCPEHAITLSRKTV